MTQQPQLHKAVLDVTGWHTQRKDRHHLNGIQIVTPPIAFHAQRLTARLFPRTDQQGVLSGRLRWASMHFATTPNDQRLEVVARLLRVDAASNELILQVYPALSITRPFKLHVRATSALLRQVDPEWSAVRLTGSLIGVLLVADHVEYVYAPIPERWFDLQRGRNPDAFMRRIKPVAEKHPEGPPSS